MIKVLFIPLLFLLTSCATTHEKFNQSLGLEYIFSIPKMVNDSTAEVSLVNDHTLAIVYYSYNDKYKKYPRLKLLNLKSRLLAIPDVWQNKGGSGSGVSFFTLPDDNTLKFLMNIASNPSFYKKGTEMRKAQDFFAEHLPEYEVPWGTYPTSSDLEKIAEKLPIKIISYHSYPVVKTDVDVKKFIKSFLSLGDVLHFKKKALVTLKPQIIDNSGYYKGEELYESEVEYNEEKNIFNISINPIDSDHFKSNDFDISPRNYKIKYIKDKKVVVTPKITINNARFSDIFLKQRFQDENIVLKITRIRAKIGHFFRRNLQLSFLLENTSRNVININSISFYVENGIFTSEKKYMLPPKVVTKNLREHFENDDVVDLIVDKIMEQPISKKKPEESKILIGVSINYSVNNQIKNLYETIEYSRAK